MADQVTIDTPAHFSQARSVRRCRWSLLLVAAVVLGAVFMSWASMIRMPGKSHKGPLPAADEPLKELSKGLRLHVTRLAHEIGDRSVTRSPAGLAKAAAYIETQFADAGYKVTRQGYDVSGVTCTNLEVELPGRGLPEDIVVIGAHYDSAPGCPAANDNGTGVAALLSLARTFAGQETDRTIRFVAFVNEEPPFFQTDQMGSRVYASRCRKRGEKITAMLALETIGYYSDAAGSQRYPPPFSLLYPSTGNYIAFVGNAKSSDLVRQVVDSFRKHEPFPSEGGALPDSIPGVGFSDHWSFWQEGYPALMVTDTAMFRYPYYHTAEDTVDKIDFEKTARVVRGLEAVIADLAEVDRDSE
jgi:Zn-dependent M28 family amino/carboxypeptidase